MNGPQTYYVSYRQENAYGKMIDMCQPFSNEKDAIEFLKHIKTLPDHQTPTMRGESPSGMVTLYFDNPVVIQPPLKNITLNFTIGANGVIP